MFAVFDFNEGTLQQLLGEQPHDRALLHGLVVIDTAYADRAFDDSHC